MWADEIERVTARIWSRAKTIRKPNHNHQFHFGVGYWKCSCWAFPRLQMQLLAIARTTPRPPIPLPCPHKLSNPHHRLPLGDAWKPSQRLVSTRAYGELLHLQHLPAAQPAMLQQMAPRSSRDYHLGPQHSHSEDDEQCLVHFEGAQASGAAMISMSKQNQIPLPPHCNLLSTVLPRLLATPRLQAHARLLQERVPEQE